MKLTRELLIANGWEERWSDTQLLYALRIGRYIATYMVVNNGCPILTIEDELDDEPDHTIINLKDEVYSTMDMIAAFKMLGLDIIIS